jgi:hypothetical protein
MVYLFFVLVHEFNQLWKWGRDDKKIENHCFKASFQQRKSMYFFHASPYVFKQFQSKTQLIFFWWQNRQLNNLQTVRLEHRGLQQAMDETV